MENICITWGATRGFSISILLEFFSNLTSRCSNFGIFHIFGLANTSLSWVSSFLGPRVWKISKYQTKSALQPSLVIFFLLAWKSEQVFPESIWTLKNSILNFLNSCAEVDDFMFKKRQRQEKVQRIAWQDEQLLAFMFASFCLLPFIFLLSPILCAAYCETMDVSHTNYDDLETGVLIF